MNITIKTILYSPFNYIIPHLNNNISVKAYNNSVNGNKM